MHKTHIEWKYPGLPDDQIKILDPCTCGGVDGHFASNGHSLSCPSILLPQYRKAISDERYKQLTSGIPKTVGAAMSIDHLLMFDIHPDDKGIFPSKIGNAGDSLYRTYCSQVMGQTDPIGDVPYLINWTDGCGELDGIITSVLVIMKIQGEWTMIHAISPAREYLRKMYEIMEPSISDVVFISKSITE
jgi:hypothetical protein